MKDLCTKCKLKPSCISLCEEAKKFVDQDYTPIKEVYFYEGDISEVFENLPPQEWPELKANTHLTPREKEILRLLGRGLNHSDICQVLEINRNTLDQHTYNLRQKLLKT